GVLEHDLGAVHVGFDGANRLLDDQFDANRRGEMEDDVGAIDELGQQAFVFDRINEVLEARTALEMDDILHRARGQIVEHEDTVAHGEHRLCEVRADKACTTRNQRTHSSCPFTTETTASRSSSLKSGRSGSDTTSAHARTANGQSAGAMCAKAR